MMNDLCSPNGLQVIEITKIKSKTKQDFMVKMTFSVPCPTSQRCKNLLLEINSQLM